MSANRVPMQYWETHTSHRRVLNSSQTALRQRVHHKGAAAEHLRAYGTGWAACLASSIPSLMGAAQVRAPSVRTSREKTPSVLETLSLRPCRPWSPSSSWASRCPWCQLQIYTYGEYVPCQETTVVCAMASDALDCVLTTRSRLHLCAQALTTEFRDHKPGRR